MPHGCLKKQVICICAAPHRTVSEKIEGIRELSAQSNTKLDPYSKNGYLENKIQAMEALVQRVYSDAATGQYLYGAEIYWCGEREWFQTETLYRTAAEAILDAKRRIEDASEKQRGIRKAFTGL